MKRNYFKKDTLRRLSDMKNNVLYLLLLCAATTIFSCSNTNSEDTSIANIQTNNIALKAFAKAHSALMDSLLATTSPNRQEDELDTAKVEKIVEDIKENFASYTDVNMDIDSKTRALAENEALDFLNMDMDSIMPFLKERTSPEFYSIISYMIEKGTSPVTEDDIINSKNLSQNEKISLLLSLPTISYDEQYNQPKQETRSKADCYSRYKSARASCGRWYIFDCALACAGVAFTPITVLGVARAVYSLDDCLDNALDNYRRCK